MSPHVDEPMTTETLQVMEMADKSRHPTPRLATASDVRREMADLYRQARTGGIEIADATKLAYILNQLATLLRLDDLEQRTAALERILKQSAPKR